MIFSKATGYAIRALSYLAGQPDERLCTLHDIAEHERIPPDFLRKILNDLRRRRLLLSVKGIHGGYKLARSPKAISLWEIFQLLEPDSELDMCILGNGECGRAAFCPLHADWQRIRNQIVNMLKTKTIQQVAEKDSPFILEGDNLC